MNLDRTGHVVQAFPISRSTRGGIATDLVCRNRIVHMLADGDITFTFDDGSTVALAGVQAGMDFSCDKETSTVTSTVPVIVS